MEKHPWLITILFVVLFLSCGKQQSSQSKTEFNFSTLSGPYLGQVPPKMTPEVFAPGIISTGHSERIAAFTPDGKELYYVMTGPPYSVILYTKEENGKWTAPAVAPFSGKHSAEFNMSPDGNKILFIYKPHSPPDPVWAVERNNNSWEEPYSLPAFISGYPTIAENGNIYFNTLNEENGSWDLYISEFKAEKYLKPENMGKTVNNEFHEADPFVAPDESYLIFARKEPGTIGGADLFISFKNRDGSWSKPVNMGENINSEADDYCPTVSPDGKYLFFMSYRKTYKNSFKKPISFQEKLKIIYNPGNGNSDIYWVDAKVINDLKPNYIK